jgi:hypothetical protein
MHRPLVRSAAVVLAAFLLASCSSSNGGSSNRLTKQELIAQGDAICKTMSDKAATIGPNLAAPTQANLPEWADALGQLLPIFQNMGAKLKDLTPPEADQAKWDQIIAGLDQEITALAKAKDAADSGDLTGMTSALMELSTVDAKTTKILADYGFKQCGAAAGGSSSSPGAASSGTSGQ